MRERSRDPERLEHIVEAIGNVEEFTAGVAREDFFRDKMRYFAVVKNIEIIGEAANMLTEEFRRDHPETPWRGITAMRNVIVHDYINISEDLLWETVQHDLAPLKQQVLGYLAE